MPSAHGTGGPDPALHAEDLALARACEAGDEAAWERFVREYRPLLQRAAMAIDPSGGASDLADALFGELYGVRERDGVRQSLFRYFQGRSKLSTWLRAVLAQRYVDRIRELKRHDPLPEADAEWPVAAADAGGGAERQRFVSSVERALAGAIAALEPRDRLRLRCYYIDDMRLAAIGRLLREHEATASRNLERTRRELRAAVEARLAAAEGFDARALAECLDAVMRDPGHINIEGLMESGGRARSAPAIVQRTRSGS